MEILRLSKIGVFVPTVIEKGASIGSNATILCGITVGEGAIIGAGSVVTKDVPAWTIAAGVPAKLIRRVDHKIEAMLNY